MSANNMQPSGWTKTKISKVSHIIRGVSYAKGDSSEYLQSGLVPILRATNIQDEKLILDSNLVFVPSKYIKPEQYIKPGDIVVCMSSGSKKLVGKAAQLNQEWNGSFGTFCATIRPNSEICPKYLGYYFLTPEYRQFIRAKSAGININNLKPSDFDSIEIPTPSLPEQERIVAKIEELFSQLDAGVAALKRVQAGLKRYKASVLKAACEGRLVPQDPSDEPAEEILKRLGKKPLAGEDLPALPNGWCWTMVKDLATVGTGATPLRRNAKYWENGSIPWITSGALNDLQIEQANEYITEAALAGANIKIFPAGSLLVAMYGEGKTRGKVSELMLNAATNQACAALTFDGFSSVCKPYVMLFFQKNYEDIRKLSSGGVQPNLNISIIKNTRIPLPPIKEQLRILAEVENRLSIAVKVDSTVDTMLSRASRLRQAVLKLAFEGKLILN